MKFKYNYYRKTLLIVPLILIIFVLIVLVSLSINIFNYDNYDSFNLFKILILLCIMICIIQFLIDSLGHLKYGILLLIEKQNDILITIGKIEKIKELRNPFIHNYKYIQREYKTRNCNAHLITISGKKYYFMIKGELKVGDYVEISYLPKSTIVLEVNIIYPE